MSRYGIALFAAMLAGTLAGAAEQPPQSPVPGMPAPTTQRTPPRGMRPGEGQQKGTAVLRGYVVAADTGNPLRRAMVRAFAQDGRSNSMTTTDGEGRFEMKELPGGSYSLTVSKAGYVTMAYGQRRPDQQGTMLQVLDGQLVEKIGFSLPRGGVITGRVTDEFGDPMAGAQINALRYRYMNGARRLQPSGSGTTDDQGTFRIFGLPPGDYYVSGVMRFPMMMTMAGTTATAVEGYAPTYFPGTPSAADAQRVIVRVAQETAGVAFALTAAKLSQVSGRVVSSTGEPVVQAMVRLMSSDRADMSMMFAGGGGMTRGDGSFQLAGVAAGNYTLNVMPRNPNDAMSEFGQVKLTVGTDDENNVLIVTSRGAIARGMITTDENTPPAARPQQVNVFARPLEPDQMTMTPTNVRVNDDWTFEMTGLSERRVLTAVLAESLDWALKGIYRDGVDVTDTGFDFVPGQTVDGFQVVFTRKRTELSGGLTDERGRPQTDATVIAFAQEPRRWTYATRFIRTVRPNQDGRYTLRGLPPEDYFVAAVRELEPGRSQDPEFLESLRDVAIRITLGEGETRTQDLKVAQEPQR